jgi:hypothetical protein
LTHLGNSNPGTVAGARISVARAAWDYRGAHSSSPDPLVRADMCPPARPCLGPCRPTAAARPPCRAPPQLMTCGAAPIPAPSPLLPHRATLKGIEPHCHPLFPPLHHLHSNQEGTPPHPPPVTSSPSRQPDRRSPRQNQSRRRYFNPLTVSSHLRPSAPPHSSSHPRAAGPTEAHRWSPERHHHNRTPPPQCPSLPHR